jgi:aromatic ring-cleaving dioxygenase
MMITEMIFYRKAIELGYHIRPEVQTAIDRGIRPVVNNIYFEKLYSNETSPSAADVRRHYEENIDRYTIPHRLTIQHFQTSEHELHLVEMLMNSENELSQIIQSNSRNRVTAHSNGIIRNVRLNGHIAGIGRDPELDQHIKDMIADKQSIHRHISDTFVANDGWKGPFNTDTGLHYIKILEYTPEFIKPFEDVRAEIENRLNTQSRARFYRNLMTQLNAKYEVKFCDHVFDQVFVTMPDHDGLSTELFSILPHQTENVLITANDESIGMTLGELGRFMGEYVAPGRIKQNRVNIRNMVIRGEIEARMLHLEAAIDNTLEQNIDKFEVIDTRRGVILRSWFNDHVNEISNITPEQRLEYYQQNQAEFTVPHHRRLGQFVLPDQKSANKHRKAITKLLKNSTNQQVSNYIRANGLNPLAVTVFREQFSEELGVEPIIWNDIWKAKVRVPSKVYKKSNSEFVFFYITRDYPESVQPQTVVNATITERIIERDIPAITSQIRSDLYEQYGVIRHLDRLESQLTAEQMFELVSDAQIRFDEINAMFFILHIINEFPDSEYTEDALFMQAYLNAKFQHFDMAIALFESFIETYPEGEMHDKATILLEALREGSFM